MQSLTSPKDGFNNRVSQGVEVVFCLITNTITLHFSGQDKDNTPTPMLLPLVSVIRVYGRLAWLLLSVLSSCRLFKVAKFELRR